MPQFVILRLEGEARAPAAAHVQLRPAHRADEGGEQAVDGLLEAGDLVPNLPKFSKLWQGLLLAESLMKRKGSRRFSYHVY